MPSRAKAVVAAGCAALTMAAVVAATPAGAAADAEYYCYGLPYNYYTVHFARDASNELYLQTELPKAAFPTGPIVTATFDGHSITSWYGTNPGYSLVQVHGIYPWTVNAAPSQIVFSQPSVSWTCELRFAGPGFPV